MADGAGGAWTFGGSILTFAFPMILFIVVAGALYVLYTKPELVPGQEDVRRDRQVQAELVHLAGGERLDQAARDPSGDKPEQRPGHHPGEDQAGHRQERPEQDHGGDEPMRPLRNPDGGTDGGGNQVAEATSSRAAPRPSTMTSISCGVMTKAGDMWRA